jgi:hypothetical protein
MKVPTHFWSCCFWWSTLFKQSHLHFAFDEVPIQAITFSLSCFCFAHTSLGMTLSGCNKIPWTKNTHYFNWQKENHKWESQMKFSAFFDGLLLMEFLEMKWVFFGGFQFPEVRKKKNICEKLSDFFFNKNKFSVTINIEFSCLKICTSYLVYCLIIWLNLLRDECQKKLHLPMDDFPFSYIFLWMIAYAFRLH